MLRCGRNSSYGFDCLQMRSTLLPGQQWDVTVDLFFYREPEETKEPGEEDAADYGNQEAYGQLPAPGGQHCLSTLAHVAAQCMYLTWCSEDKSPRLMATCVVQSCSCS